MIIKPLRRLPLGSLRVFVSVAQHLNFTRAADALGVTASAASLQIRTLEEYLARSLFRRNGRQVHLTNEGASLLPRVQHALAELERAVDDVRGDRLAGPLRVTTLPSFLQLWLLPRIARFRADHPEIDLHIHTSADMVDFVKEDFQLAIRLGMGGWPNLWAEKVLDESATRCSTASASRGPAGYLTAAPIITRAEFAAPCSKIRTRSFAWRFMEMVWRWHVGLWLATRSTAAPSLSLAVP